MATEERVNIDTTTLIRNGFDHFAVDGFLYTSESDDRAVVIVRRLDGGGEGSKWCVSVSGVKGVASITVKYVNELQRIFDIFGIDKQIEVYDDGLVYVPYILGDAVNTVGNFDSEKYGRKVPNGYGTAEFGSAEWWKAALDRGGIKKDGGVRDYRPKYRIGDRFTRKNWADSPVMKVTEITDGVCEPIYELKPIKGIASPIKIGEEGLDTLFRRITVDQPNS